MKYLMIGMMALIWTGCATHDQGRPDDESYVETSEERREWDKVGRNMGDVGRHGTFPSPFTHGNGSMNF